MATMTGVVKAVGQLIEIELPSGQRLFAQGRKDIHVGRKVHLLFNTRKKCLSEFESLRKEGLIEALLFCYDPDADYNPDDIMDLGALEPPCEEGWSDSEGIIKSEWHEPDEVLVCCGFLLPVCD